MHDKIYYICVDHDAYNNGEHVGTNSWEEGFWGIKPTDDEVESYLLKKYPHFKNQIMNRERRTTSIVWDIEEWERIDYGK